MTTEPTIEHQWLEQLIGDWECESEACMAPGEPAILGRGTEVVRSLGGLWTIGEGVSETSDCGEMRSIMTLGYDPARGRFVGSFVASSMSHFWIYDGSLDEAKRVLSLAAEGPSFSGEGMTQYVDSIEIVSPTERMLHASVLGPDGQWTRFMTVRYRKRG